MSNNDQASSETEPNSDAQFDNLSNVTDELIMNMRDRAVIDALPVAEAEREVLTVGTGKCALDLHLAKAGYKVTSTDFESSQEQVDWRAKYAPDIHVHSADIFNLSSFPVEACETVICCEVLEHLEDWKTAFKNLLNLTKRRLIITLPWWESYDVPDLPPPAGHCNYWTDDASDPMKSMSSQAEYLDIREMKNLCYPAHANITKIVTKDTDWVRSARCYLIVIDKAQVADYVLKLSDLITVPTVLRDQQTKRYVHYPQNIEISMPYPPPQRVGPYPEGWWPPSIMVIDYISEEISRFGSGASDDEMALSIGQYLQEYNALEQQGVRVNSWNTQVNGLKDKVLSTDLPFNLQRLQINQILVRSLRNIDIENFLAGASRIGNGLWFYLPTEEYKSIVEMLKDKDSSINIVNSDWVELEKVIGGIIEKSRDAQAQKS